VEIHLNKTKQTIAAADSLVEGLEGEYERWNADVSHLENDLSRLPQLSLLAAAFLVFLPSAAEDKRRQRLNRWKSDLGLTKDDQQRHFDLAHFLASEREVLRWRSEGLPPDNLSVENAVCILQSGQTPFLIDPSSRAADWLVASLGSEGQSGTGGIEITTQDDDRFVLNLELAVRLGKKLLVRDVGSSISPVLVPLLRGDLSSSSGAGRSVLIGEKTVEYNENFRLFLSTRDAAAQLPPDAAAAVSVVNFTTTAAGLTGQLLGAALAAERPELERRKSELLRREEEDKLQIGKLEDFLLEQLASSSGNILENSELLTSLNETKSKAAAVEESLKESASLQENLEKEGEAYHPLARFASRMFFLVSDLKKLSNMYRFSLAAFTNLYQLALKDAPHK